MQKCVVKPHMVQMQLNINYNNSLKTILKMREIFIKAKNATRKFHFTYVQL